MVVTVTLPTPDSVDIKFLDVTLVAFFKPERKVCAPFVGWAVFCSNSRIASKIEEHRVEVEAATEEAISEFLNDLFPCKTLLQLEVFLYIFVLEVLLNSSVYREIYSAPDCISEDSSSEPFSECSPTFRLVHVCNNFP